MKKILSVLAVVMTLLWYGSALALPAPYTPCSGNVISNWNLENVTTSNVTGTGGGGGNIGNFVGAGFDTDYIALDPASTGSWTLGPERYFTISALPPSTYHSAWATFGDHTTGTGKMMIVNASPDPEKVIWKQTVTGLIPFANYLFSYWVALSHPDNPPHLTVYINDAFAGEFDTAGQTLGVWYKSTSTPYYAWTDTAEIKIIDTTDEAWGDDFALDDFEMCATGTLPPPPETVCKETDLVRGRTHVPEGDIEVVRNPDGTMSVSYTMDTESPWCMTELHLQVGGPFPQKNGNAIPGKFEYKYDPEGCITEYTFIIPENEIPEPYANGNICIAAHAALRKEVPCKDPLATEPCYATATGWGLGKDFSGADWSMKFCFPLSECQVPSELGLRCDEGAGDDTFAYNAIPYGVVNCGPPSEAFEAQATNEFGDRVQLASGTGRELVSLSVSFNSYGCETGHWFDGLCQTTPGATFTHPITANIYNPAVSLTVPIASVTQTETIPFRPAADGAAHGCPDAAMWWNSDGNGGAGRCQYSIVKVLTFGFSPGITLPDEVLWSVEFNTSHSGNNPIGETACNSLPGGCGYDSLNVGAGGAVYGQNFINAPYAGIDPNVDEVYWGGWRTDGTHLGGICYPPPWSPTCSEVSFSSELGWTGFRPLAAISTK